MSDESDRGADLFDRWLSHREETAKDRPAPVRRAATPPRTSDAARPAAAEDAPAAPAQPAPEPDPLFDDAFVPAEPEPAVLFEATAPPEVRVPVDFEPVIIPSARKKKPEPRRLRRRPTAAPERDVEPELPPAPAPAPPDLEPEPLLEPKQEAVPEPQPESQPVPQPVPELDPDPEPSKPQTPPKSRARRPRPPQPRPNLDHPDAASAAVAVAQRSRPPAEPAPLASGNAVFAPRTGPRRVMGLLLLLAAAATAVAAYVANEQRTTPTIGIATALGVLTLVIWAVRAGTAVTRLSVTAGQLEVLRGGGRFVFDLRSTYTPIEVVGDPRRRGWQVLIHRRGMTPFVIDASMVDPEEFMRVLRHHRPAEPPAR